MGALDLAQALADENDPRLSAWSGHFRVVVAREALQLGTFMSRMDSEAQAAYGSALLEVLEALPETTKVGVSLALFQELLKYAPSAEIRRKVEAKVYAEALA